MHTCLLDETGTLWVCGHNGHGQRSGVDLTECLTPQPFPMPARVRVSAVTCGYEHTCIVTVGGVLWTCGRNNVGQCANGKPHMEERALQRVSLPPSCNHAAGQPFCTRVICGNGGSGGHTVVLYR